MLKAANDVVVRYNGKAVEVKKGEGIDIGKVFGVEGADKAFLELKLRDKWGFIEVKPEVKKVEVKQEVADDSSKSNRRGSKKSSGKRRQR